MKKRRLLYGMLAFLLPVFSVMIMLLWDELYPFGPYSLFTMDLKDQYLAFMTGLRDTVTDIGRIGFQWSKGLGGNGIGLYAYYVSGPLTWLTVFFPREEMPAAILVITLIRIGLCGVSFYVLGISLCSRGKRLGEEAALIFAVSYALISYNIAYGMCVMWLDGVMLLPMIVLGIEQMVCRGKLEIYITAVTTAILCNYYTAYMACLFGGLYFLQRLLTAGGVKTAVYCCLRYAAASMAAIGLAAPLLYPVLLDLMNGHINGGIWLPPLGQTTMPVSKLIAQFQCGQYDTLTQYGGPLIYCGTAAIAGTMIYIGCRTIGWREKLGTLLLGTVMTSSIMLSLPNLIWHGMKKPHWFMYRYSFTFSFLLLLTAMRGVWQLPWHRFEGRRSRILPAMMMILFSAVFGEMTFNGHRMISGVKKEFTYTPVSEYVDFVRESEQVLEAVRADDGFFRVNQLYEFSKNDAMLLGYNGMTHYSSNYNEQINRLMRRLGVGQDYFWNSGYGMGPMLESVFGVKYVLTEKVYDEQWYIQVGGGKEKACLLNPQALPIAFGAPCLPISIEDLPENVYEARDRFMGAICGENADSYVPCDVIWTQNGQWAEIELTMNTDGRCSLTIEREGIPESSILSVDGEMMGECLTSETRCGIDLGRRNQGETIYLTVEMNGKVKIQQIRAAQLREAETKAALVRLMDEETWIESDKSGWVKGDIVVEEGERIFTSIPFDTGWQVLLDGEPVTPECWCGALMVIPASAGKHKLEMRYIVPGLKEGWTICTGSAILLIACTLLRRKNKLRVYA